MTSNKILSFKNTSNYLSLSLLMSLKVFCKILVSFGLFQILEIVDLAMMKDENINIAIAYFSFQINCLISQGYNKKHWRFSRWSWGPLACQECHDSQHNELCYDSQHEPDSAKWHLTWWHSAWWHLAKWC